ncbi:MAG: hypothetical protein NXI04_01695 [Planctomycetaceae bacterium]|nr:hypothetical protein [Planctomycetaceae bacterium]
MSAKDSRANSPRSAAPVLLKITAILWVIWGLVHVLAGVMTIARNTPQAVAGIADAVDPDTLQMDYPPAAGAVINQHGFNLLWIGAVTTICAAFVWRQSHAAVWLAALITGLADVGYFLFMDLGGHVHFVPGTLMTLICAAAILLSGFWLWQQRAGRTR